MWSYSNVKMWQKKTLKWTYVRGSDWEGRERKGWTAIRRHGRGSYWNALNCLYCCSHKPFYTEGAWRTIKGLWNYKSNFDFFFERMICGYSCSIFSILKNKNARVWYWVRFVKLEEAEEVAQRQGYTRTWYRHLKV